MYWPRESRERRLRKRNKKVRKNGKSETKKRKGKLRGRFEKDINRRNQREEIKKIKREE